MWVLERLTPDFKTIADFRKTNGKGIKNACKAFIDLCRQMQMFTDVIVAIDGSKFKAVNSKPNNFTPQKAKDHIQRVEQSINKYLSKLDESDKNSENDASSELNASGKCLVKPVITQFNSLHRSHGIQKPFRIE